MGDILGIKLERDGSYLLPNGFDTFYRIYHHNVTVITYILCAIYSNFKEADEVSTVTDLGSLIDQAKLDQYIDQLLFTKCIEVVTNKLTPNTIGDTIRIIRKMWSLNFLKQSLLVFEKLLTQLKINTTIIHSEYIVKVWNPLQSNVTGYVLREFKDFTNPFRTTEIYGNQAPNITQGDIKMAADIPYDFVTNITSSISNKERAEFRVILLFVTHDIKLRRLLEFPTSINYFIGMSIPGFCKRNFLPVITVKYGDKTTEFGNNYYDSKNRLNQLCMLNRVFYFGNGHYDHFESRNREYCLLDAFVKKQESKRKTHSITLFEPNQNDIFPKYFCMDFNCFNNPATSNQTEELYEIYEKCLYDRFYCNMRSYVIGNSFINLLLYTAAAVRINSESIKLFETGLQIVSVEGKNCPQIAYLAEYLNLFHSITESPERSSFIYYDISFRRANLLGFTLNLSKTKGQTSNDYEIIPITDGQTKIYLENDNVEVMIYTLNQMPFSKLEFVIILNSSISGERDYNSKSRIVGMRCSGCDVQINLTVYLKIIDDIRMQYTRGYKVSVWLRDYTWSFVYISQKNSDRCDNGSHPVYYGRSIKSLPKLEIIETVTTKLRILSQLAVYVNPSYRKSYENHTFFLTITLYFCSALSIIGFMSILASSITIKDWYKKRYYTIQLSIALAFQLAFLLMEIELITQVVYFMFCYAILVQFFWMLMISYMQYLKFVKVFINYELDIIKTMLFGWLVPAIIILKGVIDYWSCMECNLCYDNSSIFIYYVLIPISFAILLNVIIYAIVMANIWSEHHINPRARKARWGATFIFPFLFGMQWVFIFAVISQWLWLSLVGSYFFHILICSQGFIVSIFAIILDTDTKLTWFGRFK